MIYLKDSEIPKFKKWLDNNGAAVLETVQPQEVVRFKTAAGVSTIYQTDRGQFLNHQAATAIEHFKDKRRRWITTNPRYSIPASKKRSLANRDGLKCFWCDKEFAMLSRLTVEHILNRMHGGSDNSRNLSLACMPCQRELGNKSVTEKIRIREKNLSRPKPLNKLIRTIKWLRRKLRQS